MHAFLNGLNVELPADVNTMTQKQIRELLKIPAEHSLCIYRHGQEDVTVKDIDAPLVDPLNARYTIEESNNFYSSHKLHEAK